MQEDTMKRLLAFLLSACLLLAVLPAQAVFEDIGNMEVVNCNEWVSLRDRPSTSAKRLVKVSLGAIVHNCQRISEDWCYAEYDGYAGYILAKYLEPSDGQSTFSAMLVTNDVALITFVPLTTALLAARPGALILTVSLETVAANLGSMATPIGNPQNLYLYAHDEMPIGQFFAAILPLTLVSLVLVVIAAFIVKPEAVSLPAQQTGKMETRALWLHAAQFVICLLSVLNVLPKWACFAAVLVSTFAYDRALLKQVDYALLATFVCFFVFVGNLGRIPAVSETLGGMLAGNELEMGILCSQVISNVPAALMLSGFTQDACALMRGVDLGGLGTLVASLASLISFKLYMKAPGAKAGRYLGIFTVMNIAFLAVLYALAKIGL